MKEIIYSTIITLLLPVIIASASLESYVVLGFVVLAVMILLALLLQSYRIYKYEDLCIKNKSELEPEPKTGNELKIEQSEQNIELMTTDKVINYKHYELLEYLTKVTS